MDSAPPPPKSADPIERPRAPEPMPAVLAQSVRILVFEDGQIARSGSGVVLGSRPLSADDDQHQRAEALARNVIVTNAHVVAPQKPNEALRYRVILESPRPDGHSVEFEALLLALGQAPSMDLALLTFDGPRLTPAQLAKPEELSVGSALFAIGAPYGRELSVSAGILSRVDYERGPGGEIRAALLKTDASIGYGASGGGLFSRESGHLVGIIEGYRTAKLSFPVDGMLYSFDIPMPGETFAAPSEKLLRFVQEQGLGEVLESSVSNEP
jgi:S1-C subfamily serine protease